MNLHKPTLIIVSLGKASGARKIEPKEALQNASQGYQNFPQYQELLSIFQKQSCLLFP